MESLDLSLPTIDERKRSYKPPVLAIKVTSFCVLMVGLALGLYFAFRTNCEVAKYSGGEVYWCLNGYTCTWNKTTPGETARSNCNITEFAKYKTLLNPKKYNNRIFNPFYPISIKKISENMGGDKQYVKYLYYN